MPNTEKKMACIVVTYNPEKKILLNLISQLIEAAVDIYVINNWYSKESTQYVEELCLKHSRNINFISLDRNYGIAKAINLGVEAAVLKRFRFAMLFDQDSIPQNGLLNEMHSLAIRLENSNETTIAAIGPRLYDPRSQVFFKFALLKYGLWKKIGCTSGNGAIFPCEFINSSGTLIFLKHWNRIGPFREDFFIDHVETEWYMRIRYLGLKCYGYCSKGHLDHRMGDDVTRFWLGRWHFMPRRSPQRHYTIVRNAVWMWQLNHTPFSWIMNSLAKIIFTLFYFSIFDKERKNQFIFILRGIRDGLSIRLKDQYKIGKNIDPTK